MNYKEYEFSVIKNLLLDKDGNEDLQLVDNEYYDLLFNMKSSGLIDFDKTNLSDEYHLDELVITVTSYGKRFFEKNNPEA